MRQPMISALGLTALCTACAIATYSGSSRPVRPATGTPDRFAPDTTRLGNSLVPAEGCISWLIDPRDGTQLVLRRSFPVGVGETGRGDRVTEQEVYHGDYEVGREDAYDVRPHEFLRVDCATGVAVGIVSR